MQGIGMPLCDLCQFLTYFQLKYIVETVSLLRRSDHFHKVTIPIEPDL